MTAASGDFAPVDDLFAELYARGIAPGLAYAVIADGRLVHWGGLGGLTVAGPRPGPDSAFRIASMTKSFTAAALLALRDEGALGLDDPIARWVPELVDLGQATADSPPLTVRDLLTMSAGLPTDDAWADRQLPLTPAGFEALLRAGFRFAYAPGTAFEYSNLGFAILGRVIAAAGGGDYRTIVERRLLDPLGLRATAFEARAFAATELAIGHRRLDGAWAPLPFAGHGEFAAMGGLFSTPRDLARWIGEFTDAFPPRDEPAGEHPLSRATRREMQQAHRLLDPEALDESGAGPHAATAAGYGFGLVVELDERLGAIVGHPGGLPGYGSGMCWHLRSGLGVVALANATYAPMNDAAKRALRLVLAAAPPDTALALWPETEAARTGVIRLLERWDDDLAARLFSDNVAMDESFDRRRAQIAALREQLGVLRPEPSTPLEASSPAAVTWWMRGERGRLKVEIELTPQRPPLVQTLVLTAVPNQARDAITPA